MYAVILNAAIALLFGFGGYLLGGYGWGWAIFFSVILFVACSIVLARVLGKRLHPAMARVQQQMQAQMLDAAIQSLRDLLPASRWVPLLRGQLIAQIGMLTWHTGKHKEAIELLKQAPPRVADAKLLLASVLWREGDKVTALRELTLAGVADKKHRLLPNVHAWLLQKDGREDDAIAVLDKFVQKNKTDEASADNLLRLRNKKRMAMEPFGMHWYSLMFEHPPASYGEMRQVRKGFRTPPKQPKQRGG